HIAIRVAVAKVGPVMLTAGTIAALSFFSLAAFRTHTIRNFGLLAGFGIVATLLVELTLIPALRAMLPAPRQRELSSAARSGRILTRALHGLTAIVGSQPRLVVALALLLASGASLCATRIHVDTSFKRQFPSTNPVRI